MTTSAENGETMSSRMSLAKSDRTIINARAAGKIAKGEMNNVLNLLTQLPSQWLENHGKLGLQDIPTS